MTNNFFSFGCQWFGGAASMPNPLAVMLKDEFYNIKNEINNMELLMCV